MLGSFTSGHLEKVIISRAELVVNLGPINEVVILVISVYQLSEYIDNLVDLEICDFKITLIYIARLFEKQGRFPLMKHIDISVMN